MSKRKQYNSGFKAKVALEALKGDEVVWVGAEWSAQEAVRVKNSAMRFREAGRLFAGLAILRGKPPTKSPKTFSFGK